MTWTLLWYIVLYASAGMKASYSGNVDCSLAENAGSKSLSTCMRDPDMSYIPESHICDDCLEITLLIKTIH